MKRTLVTVYIALTSACASGGAPEARQASAPAQGTPLAFLAGRQVLVMPVQATSMVDSPGVSIPYTTRRQFLESLDEFIASALRERGVGTSWTFAPEITSIARRNGGLVADPHALSVETLRGAKAGDDPISQTLASQIRSLVAFREGRYAIVPTDVYRGSTGSGNPYPRLRLFVIDSRTARVAWAGTVTGAPLTPLSRAMARDLAEKLADLIVAH